MKKITLALTMITGIALVSIGTSNAQAAGPFGFHFGGGRIHVDVGNVYHARRVYSGHGYYDRGHYDWHNTSHYDWHPGQNRRHGNHYHYAPGHYDFHRSGHLDYHHRGHRHHGHH